MTAININLLPTNKKAKLKYLVKFIFSKYILEIVILATAIIAIILVWSWLVLQDGFTKLAVSSTLVNKEYANYNIEIKRVNSMLLAIDRSSKSYERISPRLYSFSNQLPRNIKINSLSLDRINGEFIIRGTAKTRTDLISYQAMLNEIDWLGRTETPISKLFQKENIDFEIKAIINGIKSNE